MVQRDVIAGELGKFLPVPSVDGSRNWVRDAWNFLAGLPAGKGDAQWTKGMTFDDMAADRLAIRAPIAGTVSSVTAREGQKLAWVRANKLRDYPMPPADIPLIPHLIDLLM